MPRAETPQEFDRHATGYRSTLDASLAISGYNATYFDEYKIREVRRSLALAGLRTEKLRFLNFGCGIGKCEQLIDRYFPDSIIFSTDISPESIRIARENNLSLSNVIFAVATDDALPFDGSFDVIYCAGVLHHIPPADRPATLARLREKLAPAGSLFIFEHNPWNFLTRQIVSSCPLDEHASLIAAPSMTTLLRQSGFSSIVRRFIVFFPRSLRILSPLERRLGWCPLGAQYYCCATQDKIQ